MATQDSCSAKKQWLKLSLSTLLRLTGPTTACLYNVSSYVYLPVFLPFYFETLRSSYHLIFLLTFLPTFLLPFLFIFVLPSCLCSRLPSCVFPTATQPPILPRSCPRDSHVSDLLSHSKVGYVEKVGCIVVRMVTLFTMVMTDYVGTN